MVQVQKHSGQLPWEFLCSVVGQKFNRDPLHLLDALSAWQAEFEKGKEELKKEHKHQLEEFKQTLRTQECRPRSPRVVWRVQRLEDATGWWKRGDSHFLGFKLRYLYILYVFIVYTQLLGKNRRMPIIWLHVIVIFHDKGDGVVEFRLSIQEAEARAKMDTLKAGSVRAVAKRPLFGTNQHQPVIRTPGLKLWTLKRAIRPLSKLKMFKKFKNLQSKDSFKVL